MKNLISGKINRAAIYVRLSKEDGDKIESDSIVNQKELILDFLKDKADIEVCSVRMDDGFSGANFDRPAFKLMPEDIRTGKIDCVNVKDLSRFGRNFVEAGRFLNQEFPLRGIRFIAINDQYDTLQKKNSSDDIVIPFKNLANEKYMGDALLQKTYTVDCLTKKRVANDGTVPQYYVNNNHEAIIPRELFARVQEAMKRRSNIREGMYRRTHWNNHGKKQIVWRCVTRLNAPGEECPARTLSEVQLQNLVLEAINKVLGGKQRAIKVLETNISEVVDKIYALQKEQEEAMAANVNHKAGKERIQEMIEYLRSQPKRVTAYDEQLVRKLIEKITVYDDHLDFLFKLGIRIEIKG